MKNLRYKIPLLLLVLIWGGLAIFCWVKPADEFSISERRKLAGMPEYTPESVFSGKFFREFESCSLDQFPMRDVFRTLKSLSEFYLFGKSDNNEIYIAEGYAAKLEYPLNESSVKNAEKKLDALYEEYLKGKSGNIYVSVVPDKGYFMAEQTGHPALAYETMFDMVKEGMDYAEYIDITPALELSDYYRTDSHWRQEQITDVAKVLAEQMGISILATYEENAAERPFYGVYYGQSALPLKADTIQWLTNEELKGCRVYNPLTGEHTEIYNRDKLNSRDMYEFYLSGAAPLLVIDHPQAEIKKELIVFRDSFASSLIPLLAEGYSKITLIDTRYIQPALLGNYVEFAGADVLFLYSTTIWNNSQTFR